MRPSLPVRTAGALLLALLASPPVAAQADDPTYGEFGRVEERRTNVAAYFFHVLPGESTRQVFVWGAVRMPGVYEVSTGTDMGELLSLAGGPVIPPQSDDVRRTVTVRLLRPSQGESAVLYEAPVDQMVRERSRYPALLDGDLLQVELRERRPFSWRDGLAVAGGIAAVALAVERLVATF